MKLSRSVVKFVVVDLARRTNVWLFESILFDKIFVYVFSFVECDSWTYGIGCSQSCSCNRTNTQKCVMDFFN